MYVRYVRLIALLAATLGAVLISPAAAVAGTTGGLRGRVVDGASGAPIASVRVSLASPSQTATTTTDANGGFTFISLAPDSYVLSLSAQGYDDFSTSGISVLADQVQNVPGLRLAKRLQTIGHVTARPSGNIVKPGTTSDVYSVNAAGAAAAAAVGGPGGLNQAYSAIATVPGANVPQGQQGWNQLVYIRGGDYSDVSNELDGIPVQRLSDYAPVSTLSRLGQQEVQTYTGGTPASAESSGLSGFINQVIKTGTYPGYANATLGIGGPAFYHKAQLELSGATPSRNFTYYLGLSGVGQDYRYTNQNNGAGIPQFFAPLSIPTNNGAVYDGSGKPLFSPGNAYAIAHTDDRETVANVHFGIPHRKNGGKDDVQFLYVTSEIYAQFYSSLNDLGGLGLATQVFGSAPTYTDAYVYNGPVFAPPNSRDVIEYRQPSSPSSRPFLGPLNPNLRDGNDNGVGIEKLQYQKNFSSNSFLRLFGYGEYTNWFINGPVSAYFNYSGELDDYEVSGHAFGATALYSNQLGARHLLTATASYQTQKLETYSGDTFGILSTSFIDKSGNCYDPTTGRYASCFSPAFTGGSSSSNSAPNPAGGSLNQYAQFGVPISGTLTPPVAAPVGSPAQRNGAQWIVTEPGYEAQVDRITPFFTAASLADQYRPNERLNLNLGLRVENFLYRLNDTAGGFPARQFWFDAYNREYCYVRGAPVPFAVGVDPQTGASNGCPAGASAPGLQNTSPRTISFTAFEPRLGTTYTLNADTVLRASYGRYAAPTPTSYQQYDVVQQDLATFISQFLPLGFSSPYHESRPSYSNNYDLSLEHHFKGTDISIELTPFYRNTQDQLQNVPIGAQGVLDGINTGRQRNYGLEFLFKQGDFSRPGLAYQLSYTFTRSRIHFNDFNNGRNVIDLLNYYVEQYNSFTSACANPKPMCGSFGSSNAKPTFTNGASSGTSSVTVANPYYGQAPQPLIDRNGEFTPYDILPYPFQGANGYETPNVATLVVNYKRGRYAVTPSFTYSSGAFYGSPLQWPGYDPTSCSGTASSSSQANPQTCGSYLFIPDKYTGKFDAFGAFAQPTRVTANLQIAADVGTRSRLTLSLVNLVDHCFQRGLPWDSPTTCVYAHLPSNKLAPAGNFVTDPPVQLKYPYASWYNNSQTGFVGQQLPFSAFLSWDLKL
ncbi:MAG: TonB-dependent receptor [Candidatus Baltobacteraceae bacterium]